MFNAHSYENSRADGIAVLEVIEPDNPGPQLFVPLKRSAVHGVVAGPLADLRLTQVFGYPRSVLNRLIEAVYRFPLPGDAAVTSVTVRFGDVEIVASLKEREQAESDYQQAKEEGRQAALASRESPDVFTLQVTGIQPDQEVLIETSYTQLAHAEGAGWSLRIPLTTSPRYVRSDELDSHHAHGQPLALLRDPGHRFALDLTLQGTESVTSFTHTLAVSKQDKALRVQLQDGEVLPDRDCVLHWTPDQTKTRPNLTIFRHDEAASQQIYFLAQVAPPATPASNGVAREIVLLVDHSGSMMGPKWAASDWAVERFLSDLHEKDRFALAVFHNTTTWFDAKLRSATGEAVKAAVNWLKGRKDNGGTELGVALEQAIHLPRASGDFARHLLIVTDAEVTDAGRILRLADEEAKHAQRRRISVLCIDAAPNAFLANQLAERGGGVSRFLTSDPKQEDITTALEEVLADWAEPVLAGLRLAINRGSVETGGQATIATAEQGGRAIDLGDLPAGRALWVAGRTQIGTEEELTFRLQKADGAVLDTVNLKVSEGKSLPALKALFGARRVNGLEYLIHSGYSGQELSDQLARLGYDPQEVLHGASGSKKVYAENVRKEAGEALRSLLVQEALAYHLASMETSFVAVRSEKGQVVAGTVAVANALPAGWSPEFLTRSTRAGGMAGGTMHFAAAVPMSASRAISGDRAMPTRKATGASMVARAVGMVEALVAPTPAAAEVIFRGIPQSSGQQAILFDSTQAAGTLPSDCTITAIQAQMGGKGSQTSVTDRALMLLIFVGDLAAPRARIRWVDLLQQGERPLNLARQAGEVVRVVLHDPNGILAKEAPEIEVRVRW